MKQNLRLESVLKKIKLGTVDPDTIGQNELISLTREDIESRDGRLKSVTTDIYTIKVLTAKLTKDIAVSNSTTAIVSPVEKRRIVPEGTKVYFVSELIERRLEGRKRLFSFAFALKNNVEFTFPLYEEEFEVIGYETITIKQEILK